MNMKVGVIFIFFACFHFVVTADAEDGKDDLHDDGITLSEGRQEENEHIDEVEINQRNGVEALEGDILLTAEEWEELRREFKRTGQPMPDQ